MNRVVHFNDAIVRLAQILDETELPLSPIVIRDIYGRIRLAFDCDSTDLQRLPEGFQDSLKNGLGIFYETRGFLCRDNLFDSHAIFDPQHSVILSLPDSKPLQLLDRQITGQDWIGRQGDFPSRQRLVFFGLKGGAGRSTALTLLAYYFAKRGERVLLIDLDLESPGLSGLLLPQDRAADYGVVDWLIEDAVGQAEDVFRNMVVSSPLSDNLPAEIRVVAATGREDPFYLDKLSRAYNDIPNTNRDGVEKFSTRIQRLVSHLEESEQPDIVLIDSRAGLHDLAAISIVELASTSALLFATDTEQTWQGYRRLFQYWQARQDVARHVRERLTIVEALFPERNQLERQQLFLEKSYQLFSEFLYDEIMADEQKKQDGNIGIYNNEDELFQFSLEDTSAPHFPIQINWDARFQEFSPLDIHSGLFTESQIDASFGKLFARVLQLIGRES
jgi:cellulose biosynthesis protein BcsQ